MSNLREKLNKFIRFFSICQYLFIGFGEKLRHLSGIGVKSRTPHVRGLVSANWQKTETNYIIYLTN